MEDVIKWRCLDIQHKDMYKTFFALIYLIILQKFTIAAMIIIRMILIFFWVV